MDDLPQAPPPFDPELEATIRRNVAIYWDAEAPYERRVVARHALQALAVEGFKELLFVVDMLRSDSALQHSRSEMRMMSTTLLLRPETYVRLADSSPDTAYNINNDVLSWGRRGPSEDDK